MLLEIMSPRVIFQIPDSKKQEHLGCACFGRETGHISVELALHRSCSGGNLYQESFFLSFKLPKRSSRFASLFKCL